MEQFPKPEGNDWDTFGGVLKNMKRANTAGVWRAQGMSYKKSIEIVSKRGGA